MRREEDPVSLDIELLRNSFGMVAQREPLLAGRFYENLFAAHPAVKVLFERGRNSPEVQQQMLTEALVAVLDHLDDAPWLGTTLGELGSRHVGYGITEEMYGWVGESLLATLAEIAGDDWSPDLRDAWAAAYGAIVSLMLAGAGRALQV
jgi:hemoglobin-like flavoprotein